MMRRTDSSNNSKAKDYFWKRRPSELRGYNRTLYITTDDNDYLRVDFNLKEKRIRIYLEDNDEGGNPYYSVITNGKITVERNATTGRAAELYEKFNKRADVFSTIPNPDIIHLINNNYGIGLKGKNKAVHKPEYKTKQSTQNDNNIPDFVTGKDRDFKSKKKRKKFYLTDIIDVVIGSILCLAIYIYNHSFVTLGVLAAFIGIFIGLLDVYYREKRLNIIKMLLFLLAGVIFYIYGYYIL
ncbi:MAG: hypothetical protein V1874_02580 [Spirochaetota bacterium]